MKNIKNSWSIDNYYDVNFYNQTTAALLNNGVEFVEMITSKQPHQWFFITENQPIAINFDTISSSMVKFLITKVKPLNFNDEYRLLRKGASKGNEILPYIENDALEKARKSTYACFFNVRSKADLEKISKMYPAKIFFMGKYFNNKLKVCLACHESIRGVIELENILLEKGNLNGAGEFEAMFNHRVMKGKDYLVKFTETPYMEDGKYHNVKIQSDRASSSKYILT